MDAVGLIRDPARVQAALYETAEGALITTTGVKIYIPKRFDENSLAVISAEIRIAAIFAMVVDDRYYSVSIANAMMQITPSSISIVKIHGEECYEFSFDAGAQITPNVELVKNDTFVYEIYDEIVAKGHVPWFFSYVDLGLLFESSQYHGGLNLGTTNVVLEMIAASISRDQSDRTRYYRLAIDTIDEQHIRPPAFIPFRNIIFGATNTTSKLMGSYFDDGLLSALVNPSEKVEGIENLLRE